MAKKQKNFAAFYAIASQMPGMLDNKEEIVSNYTNGRTTSLREMTVQEYSAMLQDLGADSPYEHERKRLRSAVLHAIQEIGVDTSNWNKVDEFCMNKRIAGKVFRFLNVKELKALRKKLEAIKMKKRQEKAKEFIYLRMPNANTDLVN